MSGGPYRRHSLEFKLPLCMDIRAGAIKTRLWRVYSGC